MNYKFCPGTSLWQRFTIENFSDSNLIERNFSKQYPLEIPLCLFNRARNALSERQASKERNKNGTNFWKEEEKEEEEILVMAVTSGQQKNGDSPRILHSTHIFLTWNTPIRSQYNRNCLEQKKEYFILGNELYLGKPKL